MKRAPNRPAKKLAKREPAKPPEISPADRAYYRETWGFDPIADRVDLGDGKFRYEAWFPLNSDPGLAAAGVEVGARVDWAATGSGKSYIVFRSDQREAAIDSNGTSPGPHPRQETWQHFAALRAYVATVANKGISNIIREAWKGSLAGGTINPKEIQKLPFGFLLVVQDQVIRALQDVAMAAWEGMLRDWIAELLDTRTPAELARVRDPLNQILAMADFEKIFQDAHLPSEAEKEERQEWVLEPTEEGPLGERLAYRGHPIGLARALELLWQRADQDWWAAHRAQVEALFGQRGGSEVVDRSFAPSAVIRSTGERVLVDEGGKLDLSHRGIASLADMDFSGCAGAVKILEIPQNEIQKIENLDHLRGLEELYLDENKIATIENLGPIAPTLTVLSLHHNKINQIVGLDALTALKMLSVSGNLLTRIDGLENLTRLEQLSLTGNLITRIENLNHLPSLRDLYLDNNRIPNIQNLEHLSHLLKLHLNCNQITQIDGLDNLHSLQNLSLEHNNICRITGLGNLKNLKILILDANQVTKIENVESLNSLENFYISKNQLHSIIEIKNIPQVKVFDAKENEIDAIPDLSGNYSLKTLLLSKNKIVSIKPSHPNLGLQSLQLDGNFIVNITDLPKIFPNIESLNLSGNPIFSLEPLSELKKLQNLILSEMKLDNLTPLRNLKDLTSLTLDNSTISSLASCAKLPKLKWVNLRGTRVSDLESRNDKFLVGHKRPDGSLPLDVIGWRAYY